jgi:hypothetical protein
LTRPAGYKQCAVVASDRALGEPGSNPALAPLVHRNKKSPFGSFSVSLWLEQIRQALTIYKEDIRQKINGYKPK